MAEKGDAMRDLGAVTCWWRLESRPLEDERGSGTRNLHSGTRPPNLPNKENVVLSFLCYNEAVLETRHSYLAQRQSPPLRHELSWGIPKDWRLLLKR